MFIFLKKFGTININALKFQKLKFQFKKIKTFDYQKLNFGNQIFFFFFLLVAFGNSGVYGMPL